MKASSSAKLIWETYHFIRSLFLFSLSLSFFRNPFMLATLFRLLHPYFIRGFSRGSLKREGFPRCSLFSGFRFPFFRAKCFENHYSRYYPLFSSQWSILRSSISRYTCLRDECAIYLTHKPALIFNYKCEN